MINNNNKNPSLCIPRVDSNITKDQVYKVFNSLDLGSINRVDLVNKKTKMGDEYKCVFVHFTYWNDKEKTNIIKERIITKNDVKIIYNFPWFWKISISKWMQI